MKVTGIELKRMLDNFREMEDAPLLVMTDKRREEVKKVDVKFSRNTGLPILEFFIDDMPCDVDCFEMNAPKS